ncbi:ribosylglycohydrolase [Brachybacterium phenoliresistens]|uniref:Ribosylglycohydrolase n=1 Tax=Brachybacterium phenoliresistens TaxID=396014 RepID=Z9JSK1_9MICO|nr:ADP-ribosylglycohydrolase family protein [Brachybacterium phenoliresistens]EWS81355.1 ribosylglycohydrolase [Brachybacterium phenoliresistens]
MRLSTIQQDRAIGAILGSAAGDALGAPYEFQPSIGPDAPVTMRAGGPWGLGEWTDDTSMALPILWALAEGRSLEEEATLDRIVATWADWARDAKDVGIQTRQVLATARTAADARAATRALHADTGRTAGNGSLMRTGPVALGYLDAPDAVLAVVARRLSDLTHADPEAGDGCVLWSLAIRRAILDGALDLRAGLTQLPAARRELWAGRIDEAEARMPWEFTNNGWVVAAMQAAWSAIVHAEGLEERLAMAVRAGDDTDTVAAIAGSLAGAAEGASAVPGEWRRELHGWAGEATGTAQGLEAWAASAVASGGEQSGSARC